MTCASCGYPLTEAAVFQCPQCGRHTDAARSGPLRAEAPYAMSFSPALATLLLARTHTEQSARSGWRWGAIALAVVLVISTGGLVGYLTLVRQRVPTVATRASQPTSLLQTATSPAIIYAAAMTTPMPGWANGVGCAFAPDGYIITGHICYLPIGDYANVTISAQLQQRAGTTTEYAGFVLRRVSEGDQYLFTITGAAEWNFARCVQSVCQSVASGSAPAIATGATASNALRVVLRGSHAELYVNDQDIGGLDDSTYAQGYFGLIAGSAGSVVFRQVVVAVVR